MKKMLALMTLSLALVATPALAMNVEDILKLCKAGFEPDRIARIVEAAGIEPLTAEDWSRLKTEGCGDGVVDALLDVLAPAKATNDDDYDSDQTYDSDRDNVNVNLYGDWGTNGWYGSMFWGGRSPSWGFGYASYDPFWDWSWNWHWVGSSWYDPWWCSPHRSAYYCHTWSDPYYYCGGQYTGGYYGGGVYYRQKAARQGGVGKEFRYAAAKSSPVVTRATYASAIGKPYRGGTVATGMNSDGAIAIRKTSRTSVTTVNGTTYARTKSTAVGRGSTGVSTGAVKQNGTSTTVRTDNGYARRKTAVTNGGATSTGNTSTATRTKIKTRTSTGTSTGTSTTTKRKTSGATSTGKSSGSSYNAPSSTSVPSGTATPRKSSGGGGGVARPKGGRH